LSIAELAVAQFPLLISKSIGVVCADESMRQLWKQFHWWFLSQQQLNFHWWFFSQQGSCALTNPCVSYGSSFVDDFLVGSDSVFFDDF
jgi:hypothetical protein